MVEAIWEKAEQLCGKRLAPALELWLPHYAKHFNPLLPTQKKLLKDISPATLDRLLAGSKTRLKGLSGTRPGTLLRQQVPIQGEVWDERRLGFLEADSVAHCGTTLAGKFIWSLIYIDLCSAWTTGRAVWNKGATGVVERTRHVEETCVKSINHLTRLRWRQTWKQGSKPSSNNRADAYKIVGQTKSEV